MNELSHALPRHHTGRPQPQTEAGQLAAQITPDHDIPAYKIIDGKPGSRVVLSVPHGGWLYPQSLVNTDNLNRCASLADTGTAELGLMLADGTYPVLIASCGRAACDLNRPPEALDALLCEEADLPLPPAYKAYVAAGYGVIPRLSARKQPLYQDKLTRARWQALLAAWHMPYHHALTERLHSAANGRPDEVVLVDLHSMPDNPKQAGRRLLASRAGHLPDFVFGNLHGATLTQTFVKAVDEVMRPSGYSWRWNTPYAGGYITRHYGLSADEDGAPPPVNVLQIEVNRGLYSTPAGQLDQSRLAPVHQMLSALMAVLARR